VRKRSDCAKTNTASEGNPLQRTWRPCYELPHLVFDVGTSAEGADEQKIATEAGGEVPSEIAQPSPDTSKIKRTLATLKGILTALVVAGSAGATEGVAE
jgi:hypothetical protein